MAKYKVIGPHSIAGVSTGGTVDLEDDKDVDAAALVAAGHLEPVRVPVERRPKTEKSDG